MKLRMLAILFGAACTGAVPLSFAAPPSVEIAQEPLFNGRANVHPNLLLNLSVEFPTVGMAYRGDGGTYNRTREYPGYFNPAKCYVYEGGNRNLGDDAYFRIHKNAHAKTRECGGDSFSGNFMNWAASSAIDLLRYALTGGDRVIDKPGFTVLQRAVLRDAASGNFYAHDTYFPRRAVKGGGNASVPRQVTPFDVDTLYVVSCRNRILFTDEPSKVTGGSSAAQTYCLSKYDGAGKPPATALDKKLGEYLVRVRVCDDAEGSERTDLCRKYGGHYKPVGELQRNAHRVRVGATGYLLDDAPGRYGGVLRAPLKYLGAKRFVPPAFIANDNNRPEWHEENGSFYSNPENPLDRNNASVNSGVINYLNKFGRSGRYKGYDPVAELYYEGLRYLQGKQPTPAAVSGVTEAMKDGFPALTSWDDPITASCQRNYILTIADVNTHWDRYIPGNSRTTYGGGGHAFDSARAADPVVAGKTPALDVTAWTDRVGKMEADTGRTYSNPDPNPVLKGLAAKDTGAAGHGTYYMAGLAYWANTNDIRLDKPVRVKTFTIDVDEGGDGKIDGNRRALQPRDSQLYLAAKYGGFEDRNGDGNPFVTLDVDGKSVIKGSNKEWANGAGVPANYFLASQPGEMIAAIRRVFSTITAGSGTMAGVGLSSSRVAEGGTHVYQPGFDPARWSGSLSKLSMSLDESSGIVIAPAAEWDAAEILTGKPGQPARPVPDKRRIFTAGGSKFSTTEFKWDELDPARQALLEISPEHGKADGLGKARVEYLRGAREREIGKPNGVFRARDRVLGDIVNSNPVYVGAPGARANSEGYAAYLNKQKARKPTVYVGANDGMLHAFDATNGIELFAYVPNALIPALPKLTHPDYVHRPYVDGGLSAADARVGGQWRTVLAGAFGGGAQGVFALDVTDPENFKNGGGALFEFTDADDPDMGNVIGAPEIGRFHTGSKKGIPQYGDFLVVASGLNNYVDDGARRFNDDAASALFLLSLDKPGDAAWKLGANYFKVRLPVQDKEEPNGLAPPALITGHEGAVRRAYMGDLQGNLWRLDFADQSNSAVSPATPKIVFTARSEQNGMQPITARPGVAFAPGGGYLILIGTGKFVENSDAAPGAYTPQSFYAIHDTGTSVAGRSVLAERSVVKAEGGGYTIEGDAFGYGRNGKRGWYIDFPNSTSSGERSVTPPVLLDGTVFFNTLIPGADPCSAGGGASWQLKVLTGLPADGRRTAFVTYVGLLGAPVVLDLGTDVGKRNAIGARIAKRRHHVVNFGTGGTKGTVSPAERGDGVSTLPAGRFSWREIFNWQELRNAFANK